MFRSAPPGTFPGLYAPRTPRLDFAPLKERRSINGSSQRHPRPQHQKSGHFLAVLLVVGVIVLLATALIVYLASESQSTPTVTSQPTTTTTGHALLTYVLQQNFTTRLSDTNSGEWVQLQRTICEQWRVAYDALGMAFESCFLTDVRPGSVECDVLLAFSLVSQAEDLPRIIPPDTVFTEQQISFPAGAELRRSVVAGENSVTSTETNSACSRSGQCASFQTCRVLDTGASNESVICGCYEDHNQTEEGCIVNGDEVMHQPPTATYRCVQYCTNCTGPGTCEGCQQGYLLQNNSCQPDCSNDTQCVTCAAPGVCKQCAAGHQTVDGGICTASCSGISYCTSCTSPIVCTDCQEGYQLGSNICKPSCPNDVHCIVCAAPDVCTKCEAGYTTVDGEPCSVDCGVESCELCTMGGECSQCRGGYTLTTGGICAPDCSNDTQCGTCAAPGVCKQCKTGYQTVDGGICTASCSDIAFCTNCTDPNQCADCEEGYQLVNNSCEPNCTPSGCTGCIAPNFCMECTFSYKFTSPGTCTSLCPFSNSPDPMSSTLDRVWDPSVVFMMTQQFKMGTESSSTLTLDSQGKISLGSSNHLLTHGITDLDTASGRITYRESQLAGDLALATGYACYWSVYNGHSTCDSCGFTAEQALIITYEDVKRTGMSDEDGLSGTIILAGTSSETFLICIYTSFPSTARNAKLGYYIIGFTDYLGFDKDEPTFLTQFGNSDFPGVWVFMVPIVV